MDGSWQNNLATKRSASSSVICNASTSVHCKFGAIVTTNETSGCIKQARVYFLNNVSILCFTIVSEFLGVIITE